MFNNFKLWLSLLLLLSLLLSYSVAVVSVVFLFLQARSGEDRTDIPWRTSTAVLVLNATAVFCHFVNFGTRMSATDASPVDDALVSGKGLALPKEAGSPGCPCCASCAT